MREIKFRVWDKDNQKMWDRIDLNFCMKYGQIYIDNDYIKELGISKNVELMQYTGLKDKNGKKIYEGDILAAPHTYNIEIIYKNGGFLMEFFDDIGEKCEYHLNKELIEQDDLEIIGNKYENPELLGDVNECSR